MKEACTKLIFLGFDGVITTQKSKWKMDTEKCNMIKQLCDDTWAKIIISSSWRSENLTYTIEDNHLENWILKDYCIGTTKRCHLSGKTDNAEWFIPRRGMEVEEFIDRYTEDNSIKDEVYYCIFDDDIFDYLYSQRNHIIQTYWKNGVSESNIKKAKKMLSEK